jgi:hypothetical protein
MNSLKVVVEDHNWPDIQQYVQDELSITCPDRATMVGAISNKARGVFQWVSVVLPILNLNIDNGEPLSVILKRLDGVPPELSDLYAKLFENLTPEEHQNAGIIILWLLFAQRPLTLADLRYGLAFTDLRKTDPSHPLQDIGKYCPRSLEAWKSSSSYFNSPEQFLRWIRKQLRGLVEAQPYNQEGSAIVGLDNHIVTYSSYTKQRALFSKRGSLAE